MKVTEEERAQFVKDYCPKKDPCVSCYREFDSNGVSCGYCDEFLEALAWNEKHKDSTHE